MPRSVLMAKPRVLHFVRKPELRHYLIQGKGVELLVNQHVFPPSPHGCFFAESIRVKPGEIVADIGTGTGILAILAAKLGGVVYATDSSPAAIRLARENAKRNSVEIRFFQGRFFAGLEGTFDVIIANLPQEIVPASYRKAIGPKLSETIHAGPLGNEPNLALLKEARARMHKNTRFYMIFYTLNDFLPVLKRASSLYDLRLIAAEVGPTKEFVQDNPEFYKKLVQKGKCLLFKENHQWKAVQFIVEMRKKGA